MTMERFGQGFWTRFFGHDFLDAIFWTLDVCIDPYSTVRANGVFLRIASESSQSWRNCEINCLVQSAGNSGWSVFSCNKINLIIFSANFNKPESCQPGSTASNVFNNSSVVSPISENSHMYDFKVIVKDIVANDESGKSKALNVSQDKIHVAHSRQSADLDVLDHLEKKAAILWPQMCYEEALTKLYIAVMPKVLKCSLLQRL